MIGIMNRNWTSVAWMLENIKMYGFDTKIQDVNGKTAAVYCLNTGDERAIHAYYRKL